MNPVKDAPQAATSARNIEFLFLASHGLLSPISAIRWGSNRLSRMDASNLRPEQRELVTHIHQNSKVLSKLFGSMLLLARNEDQTYTLQEEAIPLPEFLAAQQKEWQMTENGTVIITCPQGTAVQADPALLETVIQNLLSVFSQASRTRHVDLEVQSEGLMYSLIFTGPLELSFVQSAQTLGGSDAVRPVVGGTPGLLLSLVHALLSFMGGSLHMQETTEGIYRLEATLPAA